MRANGRVLKAYANAIAAFAGDSQIPMEKRNIENYDVEFRENRQYYFIYFAAHMSPSEKLNPKDSGETGLGKSVMYILSKDDLTIRRRYFFA